MRQENIFRTGEHARGESMIGYERYFDQLLEYALYTGISKGISVSGMHQFGKTSLMLRVCAEAEKQKESYVSVYIDLAELDRGDSLLMFELLKAAAHRLKREFSRRGVKDELIEEDFAEVLGSQRDCTTFRESFKLLLEDAAAHFHIILVIDEFDSAKDFSVADDELLRSIMTNPKYNTSLFLVSRRQIKYIVNDNRNNSTLPANINNVYICGFSEEDKQEYFHVLEKDYEAALSPEEKETIEYYAGIVPSLYSKIGHSIAQSRLQGKEADIAGLCMSLSNDFYTYYEILLRRLESDGILKDLYSAVVGPNVGLTAARVNALESTGYLTGNGGTDYYAFSPYFTSLLHSRKVEALEWESLIAVEKRLKHIAEEQLARFGIQAADKEKYECLLKALYRKKGQTYNPSQYDGFIKASWQNLRRQCTLLDVISLKTTVSAILSPLWTECFAQYFDNAPFREWEPLFAHCGKARDPLAHGHRDFLSAADCSMAESYCKKILETLARTAPGADKSSLQPPIWLQTLLDGNNGSGTNAAPTAPPQPQGNPKEMGIMTYQYALRRPDTKKAFGVVGYIDSPERKGMLHIQSLKKGFVDQGSMERFIILLEQKKQIKVAIDGHSQQGMQFSLIDVSPDFDQILQAVPENDGNK